MLYIYTNRNLSIQFNSGIMKNPAIFVVTTLLLVPSSFCLAQSCADPANIYAFNYNLSSYEVVKEMKSWVDAAACAVERGGYLVQINNQGEQDAIYDAIVNGAGVPVNYTVVPDGGGIAYVWIGATDKVTEGEWLWDGNDDGIGVNFWNGEGAAGNGGGSAAGGAFINWGGKSTGVIKEPDDFGSGQDAAAIALDGWPSGSGSLGIAGEWNDISLTNSLFFVIEIDHTSVIEKAKDPLKIFPNPAFDLLTVKMNQTSRQIESLMLINTLGAVILQKNGISGHEFTLDIHSIPSGFYILTVRMDTGTKIIRRIEILR